VSCDKVQAQRTAYLDGELADERGSAVRGHLRTCEDCRRAATAEAALRDGLRELPPVDPPASLWAGVQQKLAAAEMADAERPAWRRALTRWLPKAPQLAFGGAIVAAAIALIVIRLQRTDERERTVSPPVKSTQVVIANDGSAAQVPVPHPPAPLDDDRDVTDVLKSAPARVTDDYAATARDLLPLAQEARVRWSEGQQKEFDAKLVQLQQNVTSAGTERAKQREYRTLIRFLQRAAIRDEVALASIGGAP
jgi:hypothetical protein